MTVLLAFATAAAVLAPCRAAGPAPCSAYETGRHVAVSVEVEGQAASLYAAPDGSARRYFEAREGAPYLLRLRNLTAGRLAVRARVDGLNVISGEREGDGVRGRMYVLAPWDTLDVRGWRTSLEQVRTFTFVDEKRSYAARTGQAANRMGWIEIDVYRERARRAQPITGSSAERADGVPAPRNQAPAQGEAEGREEATAAKRAGDTAAAAPSAFPGTGWGGAAHDPAQVVAFDAEARPVETLTLRYEYASGLRALGIPLARRHAERLIERDRGTGGFARPPRN